MAETEQTPLSEQEYQEAQKRVRKIKKYYKDLASWAGTSVILLGLNLFLSGHISWAKYPVVIWGIVVLAQIFEVIRLQRLDKEWEEKQLRRFTGKATYTPPVPVEYTPPVPVEIPQQPVEDYSEELLQKQEREIADLSEYRKLKRPWEDQDLV